MASDQGDRKGLTGPQLLALPVFGVLLLALFLGFAVAQGIGEPDIPSGAVAVIEDAPEGLGTITADQLEHAVEHVAGARAAEVGRVEPIPKPGDEKYEELAETALGELIDTIWIQGLAEEMGISVTPKEVAAELKQFKESTSQAFLKEAHYNQADMEQQAERQILSTKIQDQLKEEVPEPSSSEIEDYYEAAKSSQYTTQSLEEAKPLISNQLSERSEQQDFTEFLSTFESTWASRTFCAPEVVMERCANFEWSNDPAVTVYSDFECRQDESTEESSETVTAKEHPGTCPAPVAQIKPALPGSVTILEPGGRKLAQRPRPAGLESSAEAAPEAPELIE